MPTVKGVAPGFLLLPAREYDWELVTKVEIRVPNEGSIRDLVAHSKVSDDVNFPGADNFTVLGDNLLLLWELTRVLFASTKYPDLKDNECLNVVALEIAGPEIVLYGEVIRSV